MYSFTVLLTGKCIEFVKWKIPSLLFRPKSKSGRSNLAGDVAVPEAFITDFSLKNTITNIEGQLDQDGTPHLDDEDVMPSAAAEMGAGKLTIKCQCQNWSKMLNGLRGYKTL